MRSTQGHSRSTQPTTNSRAVREGANHLARSASDVPARFMVVRVVLYLIVGALVLYGLLMIYSASSIYALSEKGNPAYYFVHQLAWVVLGLIAAGVLALQDFRIWLGAPTWFACAASVFLLVLTRLTGTMAKGATRWINIAGFSLQPSEFAKVAIIVAAAFIAQRYFAEERLTGGQALGLSAVGIGLPLFLILVQPDKGTTLVVGVALVVMLYIAGVDGRIVLGLLVIGVSVFFGLSFADEYSRRRLMTMLHPENDPLDAGYQLLQGFYAFASGGLFGKGLGMSRQKYLYLPEAHNDFIFAIIGEELGLVGALLLVGLFVALALVGFRIYRHAPNLGARIIAGGATTMLIAQALLNVMGVLGAFPLSGKPLPFVSYGGSSVISCLMLVGLLVSVSRGSALPETEHDRRRRAMIASAAYEPAEPATPAADLHVIEGGRASRSGQSTQLGSARTRINLGPSAAERLRGSSSRNNTRR